MLLAKTIASRVEALSARVRDLHPYTAPCILVLGVLGGSAAYLDWLAEESHPQGDRV